MYFPLLVGNLCLSLFWYALLCVRSSFAIFLKRKKRELVVLLLLSNWYLEKKERIKDKQKSFPACK